MDFLANLQVQPDTHTPITRENIISVYMTAVVHDELLLLEFIAGHQSEQVANENIRNWKKLNKRIMKHLMMFTGVRNRSDDLSRTVEYVVWDIEANVRKATRDNYENSGCGYTLRRIRERVLELEQFFI